MAIWDAKTSETGAEQGRRVEGSTAWLGWLVQGAGHELMLFASVGILLFGLDDLLFDALWFGAGRARRDAVRGRDPVSGTVAVFVPAWREAAVLPATRVRPSGRGLRAVPSSAPVRVASKSVRDPRKVATTMCFTENPNDEWTGSLVQVPVGTAVTCSVVVLIVFSLAVEYR